ncbi:tripartite-type tricarboxylate transporter receptor subunit TctC [Cupriavidus gilardii J11]|uniref:Tripartite-type tricarboxylate transporter receptor subunit TctC n=1 Tax=Cupriavidus gilardii J11 TaxID=936133 RepID=A0A562B9K7_9BURK|nr:tripartite tricarboxylate transporter substrate binding protein [Cupriavidus gilardii]TWG81862.1 tripartite-type tricarboxylate transporter receptor subunit TctC [Cupriavidus gilardii J11]
MKVHRIAAAVTLSSALIAGVAGLAKPAHAEPYPARPVKLLVGYPAGGASDTVGRIIANELSHMNGQPVVVENRPGVGGMLAMGLVAKSPADGYTLGVAVSGTMVIGPHLVKATPYDPLTAFAPVSMVAKAPMVLVASPSASFDNVKGLIREARARPDGVMFAAGAQAFDLAMRLFATKADVRMGSVSYAGGTPASIDVMAGRVPVMVDTIGAQQANIRAGKLKALAVLDDRRSAVLPDVPTMIEAGVPGYRAVGWLGIVAPKGTPAPIVDKLNKQLGQIMAKPEVAQKLLALGFEPDTGSASDFARDISEEHASWGAVVKTAGLTAQ